MKQDDAQNVLGQIGLVLGSVSYLVSPGTPDGTIVGQYPSAGAHVAQNGSVAIVLAGPPHPSKHDQGKQNEH